MVKHPLIDRKRLVVDWNATAMKYTGWVRFQHNPNAHSFYLRILALEVAVWYR